MTNNSESSGISRGQEAIREIKSPLAGVDSRSLDALMAEDVEALADADVDRIVAELRRVRAEWEKSEVIKQNAPKGRAKADPQAKAAAAKLTLDDLGF